MTKETERKRRMGMYCTGGMGRPLKAAFEMMENSEGVLRQTYILADREKFKMVYIKRQKKAGFGKNMKRKYKGRNLDGEPSGGMGGSGGITRNGQC